MLEVLEVRPLRIKVLSRRPSTSTSELPFFKRESSLFKQLVARAE